MLRDLPFFPMTKTRHRLTLALCALTPFVLCSCAGDDKSQQESTPPVATVASPAPQADALVKSFAEASARVRSADAALAALAADSVTDPEDRIVALDKALAALKADSAAKLGAELKGAGDAVVAGWDASVAAVSDPALRKIAEAGRDDAKGRADKFAEALKGADLALAEHTRMLGEVAAALGRQPNSTQRIAARAPAAKVAASGKKSVDWLTYAARCAQRVGAAPLPAPVTAPTPAPEQKPDVPAAPPAEPAPAPVTPPPPPPAPVAPEPKPIAGSDPLPEPKGE